MNTQNVRKANERTNRTQLSKQMFERPERSSPKKQQKGVFEVTTTAAPWKGLLKMAIKKCALEIMAQEFRFIQFVHHCQTELSQTEYARQH